MRISKWKRAGSGLLAAVIAASVYVGAAVPAAAAAVGDDGSAEMNEAYAAAARPANLLTRRIQTAYRLLPHWDSHGEPAAGMSIR